MRFGILDYYNCATAHIIMGNLSAFELMETIRFSKAKHGIVQALVH
jgi:hypothetical protein